MRNKTILFKIKQLQNNLKFKNFNLIVVKKYDYSLYIEIINKTKFLKETTSLKERLYCIEHNLKNIPICIVCKQKHVRWYGNSYTTTCSTKCSHNTKQYRKNYEQAIFNKYGKKYPLQCDIFKKQIKATLKEKYGNETYNNREKFKKTMFDKYGDVNFNNREKAKQTCLKLYGNENYRNHAQAALTNIQKYGCSTPLLKKKTNTISSLNKRVFQILNKHHIYFNIEFSIKHKNKRYSYDIKFNNNFILEINGDFWHANPKIYKPNDHLNMPKGKFLAKNIWKYDKLKNKIALKNNYYVKYLWESDINNMSNEEIFKFIKKECFL